MASARDAVERNGMVLQMQTALEELSQAEAHERAVWQPAAAGPAGGEASGEDDSGDEQDPGAAEGASQVGSEAPPLPELAPLRAQ
eukprot:3259434-Prymnesium_polylepis.1